MFKTKIFNFYYKLALALKGLVGLLEIAGGLFLYYSSASAINNFWLKLLHEELIEDPRDAIANWLVGFFQSLSVELKFFLVLYLAVNGIIKLFLVSGLWLKKNWVYPIALVILAAFIVYQIYRLSFHFSAFILFSVIDDAFIFIMVWRDWRQVLQNKAIGRI